MATDRLQFVCLRAMRLKRAIIMPISTLYLCYFGVSEPLVQTQVLPYLRQLAAKGVAVNLLTFEPQLSSRWSKQRLAEKDSQLAAEGIRWFYLPYHKQPTVPATFYDVIVGAWTAARLVRRYGINVLHARGQIPMAMALLVQLRTDCRIVFDHRGLVAEERVDSGLWSKKSFPFRTLKMIERISIRRADQVVVLTNRMRNWLIEHEGARAEKLEVIPCCVDFSRYGEEMNAAQGKQSAWEVVYAGSVTGLYLLEEMGRFFLKIKEQQPTAFLRILTVASPPEVETSLRHAGVDPGSFWVGAVEPGEVPVILRRAQLGISFRLPTFSQIAASPTKIPEYLAAGLPVVSNAGIGDMDELLEDEKVGVVVRTLDDDGYAEAAKRALALASDPGIQVRCEQVARQHFDLADVGGERYRNVYRRIEQAAIASKVLS